MREGRSERAQTMPESTDTSPDWMPWVITGRSAARLSAGLPMPPSAAPATDAAAVVRNRRRVGDAVRVATAIGPPPLIRGGPCLPILTVTQRLCDGWMTQASWHAVEQNPPRRLH